jgi:O-antigen ligase
MTSAIGVFLIIGYIILNRLFGKPHVWLIVFFIIYILVFLFLIWYGNDIEQVKWATAFVEETLSKDTTFSKRTVIWANAVDLIQKSPLFGYGIQDVGWNDNNLEGSGAHNIWVMLLLNGGFIACFGFMFITIFAIREALSVRSKITTAALMSLCVLFVMSFFEAYNIIYMFLFLQIVYYSSCIPLQLEEKEALTLNDRIEP